MIISDLKGKVRESAPHFDAVIALVKANMPFYTGLSQKFYDGLPGMVSSDDEKNRLMSEILAELFAEPLRSKLEKAVEDFSKVKYRLAEVQADSSNEEFMLGLREISEKILKLLTYHLEFHKYKQGALSYEEAVKFIIRFDELCAQWDRCVQNYYSHLKITKNMLGGNSGGAHIDLCFSAPDSRLSSSAALIDIIETLRAAYSFILETIGGDAKNNEAHIHYLESGDSLHLGLQVASEASEPMGALLRGLEGSLVKNVTLLKHLLETFRLSGGEKLQRTKLNIHANNLLKLLKKLPPNFSFAVVGQGGGDGQIIMQLPKAAPVVSHQTKTDEPKTPPATTAPASEHSQGASQPANEQSHQAPPANEQSHQASPAIASSSAQTGEAAKSQAGQPKKSGLIDPTKDTSYFAHLTS